MDITLATLIVVSIVVSLFIYSRSKKSISGLKEELNLQKSLFTSLVDVNEGKTEYALDDQFRYLYFNPLHADKIRKLYGSFPEKGMDGLSVFPEIFASQYRVLYEKALSGELTQHTQKIGDQYLHFDFSRIFSNEKTIGISVQVSYMTEKMVLEEELDKYRHDLEEMVVTRTKDVIKQRNFFQTTIDEDPNFIFVRNKLGEYVLVNKAVAESFKKTVKEVIGSDLKSLVGNKSNLESYLEEDQEILETGKEVHSESRHTWHDGSQRWLFTKKKRISVNNEFMVLGVQSDITYLKETQENLEHTNKELTETLENLKEMQLKFVSSEKIASIGLLTSGFIHEINNPINYVAGNIAPLLRDFEDLKSWVRESGYLETNEKVKEEFDITSYEIHELLKGVKAGANKISELVVNLRNLTLSPYDDKSLCDVNFHMSSTVALLKPALKDKIVITEDYQQSLPKIEAIPSHIQQVFLNILDIAIHNIVEKGTILVKTYTDEHKVIILVEDDGKEIDNEDLARMVDPFNKKAENTGLGLAISYRTIRKLGGQISVNNLTPKGTRFLISLPGKEEN
ncbi:MAG: ATP-binding protein [Cyclobacteriaceae bacterium]|nr:ATP-binding protein [Cyclobacteriaceae bacterium]